MVLHSWNWLIRICENRILVRFIDQLIARCYNMEIFTTLILVQESLLNSRFFDVRSIDRKPISVVVFWRTLKTCFCYLWHSIRIINSLWHDVWIIYHVFSILVFKSKKPNLNQNPLHEQRQCRRNSRTLWRASALQNERAF